MAYLSYTEYTALTRASNPVEKTDFDAYEEAAEVVIDSYVFDAIQRFDLLENDRYTSKIKKAVTLQVDYIRATCETAEEYAASDKEEASHSVSVGETSESVTYIHDGKDSANKASGGSKVAPLAVALLTKIKAIGRSVG